MLEPFLGPWLYPDITRLVGRFVTVERLDPQRDCADLFRISHTPPEAQKLFRFMSFGPFDSLSAMQTWLDGIASGRDPLYFSVLEHSSGQRVGMISLLNIFPAHGRCELGNIWYSPQAQRTRINSEVTYLFLKTLFQEYRYRRVEWKCDDGNQASKRAALRMGFHYEGLFRKHMLVKGKSRDTAWFALFDEDWPLLEEKFEAYLSGAVDSLARLTLEGGEG
jgi:RimJ/RimL family protein N-acetyltransferase